MNAKIQVRMTESLVEITIKPHWYLIADCHMHCHHRIICILPMPCMLAIALLFFLDDDESNNPTNKKNHTLFRNFLKL